MSFFIRLMLQRRLSSPSEKSPSENRRNRAKALVASALAVPLVAVLLSACWPVTTPPNPYGESGGGTVTATTTSPASRFPSETPINRNQCPPFDSGCRQWARDIEYAVNIYESYFPPTTTTTSPVPTTTCPPISDLSDRQKLRLRNRDISVCYTMTISN